MKKISFLFAFCLIASISFAQTADEVINKFIEASGGKEKLDAITTLQYKQVVNIKSPFGEVEMPIQFFKQKDKLVRIQTSMQMLGSSDVYTLATDTSGYVSLPANPFTGDKGGLKKLEDKERKLMLLQSDVQGFFSGLVNYAAKGNKVEKLADEVVNNEPTYKIKLTDATGQEVVYYISKSTNQVIRQDSKGASGAALSGIGGLISGLASGASIDKLETSVFYSDYVDIEGLKFPTKLLIKTGMGDSFAEYSEILVNKPIDAKWYQVQ